MKNDVTILIQGKFHPNIILSLGTISPKYKVVISTWSTEVEDEFLFFKYVRESNKNVTFIFSNIENLKEDVNNTQNRYYQFTSTLRGLSLVDTEYCLKLRSDEYYTNMEPIIKKFMDDDSKLVTNNIFFRKHSVFPYHPSDHMLIGKTSILIDTFSKCKAECEDYTQDELLDKYKDIINLSTSNKNNAVVVEQQIGINWVLANDPKIDLTSTPKDTMLKYFDVVDVRDLGFYSISYSGKSVNRPETFFDVNSDITSMDDL